jgi:hypothetical protein
MVTQEGVVESSEGGRPRRSQEIQRARRRRRRPNITGARHTVEVVLDDAEMAAVREAAEEAGSTVPWFLVQSAVNPVPASAGSGSGKPWLPWPKRQALAQVLVSATAALDEIRLAELAKIGGNLNQIAHAANIGGTVGEEILDVVAELREALGEVRERAETIEQLAKDVTRR